MLTSSSRQQARFSRVGPGSKGTAADARVLGGTFAAGSTFGHVLPPGRRAYVVSPLGRVDLNGVRLEPRDGAAVTDERQLQFAMLDDTELIVVEVA